MSYIASYEPTTIVNEMNKIIEHAFRPLKQSEQENIDCSQWIPAVDIKEEKNQFVIFADLPGVNQNDVQISIENNVLIIKGVLHEISREEKARYYRVERVKGNFYRRFSLPDTVDASKIEAKMKKGVLELLIPKKEAVQAKSISIQIEE